MPKRKALALPVDSAPRRATADVYATLRDAILAGRFEPGSVLTQVDIARELGVSRTPVREALRRLQESGLVAAEPNYRTRVVGLDLEELESLYVRRLLLESFSAYRTAGVIRATELVGLRGVFIQMMELAEKTSSAWVQSRQHLHAGLSVGAGGAIRRSLIEIQQRCLQFEESVDRARDRAARKQIVSRYQEIVDAVARADAERTSHLLSEAVAHEARDTLRHLSPDHAPLGVFGALAFVTRPVDMTRPDGAAVAARSPASSVAHIDPLQSTYLVDAGTVADEVQVPARGRPRDASKREAILAAAHELFLKFGPDAITMGRLADEAKVSKGTLYAHFSDKEAVLEAWVRRESEMIVSDSWRSQHRSESLEDTLTALGQHLLAFLANPQHLALQRIVYGIAGRDAVLGQRLFLAGPARIQQILKKILQQGQENGEIRVTEVTDAANDLIGLWQGFLSIELGFNRPPEPRAAYLRERAAHGARQFMKLYGAPNDKTTT